MPPLRVIFMGTAELARASLTALLRAPDLTLVAVVSQPDRPRGRDLKLQPTPVKAVALAAHLPVLQPERARDESFVAQLRELQPELIVVAAYGQILPASILSLPRFGCVNVHTSLLPRYRGAAPIQWAILDDLPETGVTIMRIDAGLDTGDILTHATTPITPADTAQTLHDRLAVLGGELLVRTIPEFVAGRITPRPQPTEGVSYARKIQKEDGHLDWQLPARVLWNRVRGLTPWPGTFTFLPAQPKPCLLKIWAAEVVERAGPPGQILPADKHELIVACGANALRILSVQTEGGKRLDTAAFLAGHPLAPGVTFS